MGADRTRRWEVPGYDVAELIGFGTSGEVWLARERTTGEPVALKRLRPVPGARPDAEAAERVAREAALLSALHHPHLLRLRAVLPSTTTSAATTSTATTSTATTRASAAGGAAGPGLVLVLDHAAGGSLASLLAVRGTITPGEVVTVAAPVAEALAHVHSRGLVHGDVTPANVLLTADGRPLLADLGVARLLGEPLDVLEGTPGYTDPAVLAGAVPTPAADVFGLAATALTALCGPVPVAGDAAGAAEPAWDLDRLRGVAPAAPPALLEVLAAALAPRPDERPGAAELAVALHDACPPEPVRRRPARAFGWDGPGGDLLDHASAGATGSGEAPAGTEPRESGTRVISRPRPASVAPRTPRRRRLPRRAAGAPLGLRALAVALALVAALAGATAVLVDRTSGAQASSRRGGAPAPASPAPTTAARATPASAAPAARAAASAGTDARQGAWGEVLATLYAGRSQAFAAADPAMLASVYAPGSADLASNTALVRQLAADGARVPDLRLEVRSASLVPAQASPPDEGRVLLDVVDVLAPYELTDGEGRVLERRAGRGAQRVRVELTRVDGEWLIARTSLPVPS